ncbi:MipA/OmpV family protein [Algicola sagamiensis]|uniref:MipA/OmpV family protein n=1 Tax=Algicola sagamiensis TaxID=163869 RepID=UPI0003708C43|nr:MipA/OmpV family protein [Algicola sagamiensis]
MKKLKAVPQILIGSSLIFAVFSEAKEPSFAVGPGFYLPAQPYQMTDYRGHFIPYVYMRYQHFYVDGVEMGSYLHDALKNKYKVFVRPSRYQLDLDHSDLPERTGNRQLGTMLGLSGKHYVRYGIWTWSIAHDVLGRNDGIEADLYYGFTLMQKGDPWDFAILAGLEYQNQNYNDYYFGIRTHQSSVTLPQTYHPTQTISPALRVRANFQITHQWLLRMQWQIEAVPSEIRDSGLVEESAAHSGTFGFIYKFQ